MELIVAKVFDKLMGPSSGPNIKLFHRFGECWSSIDRSSYESGLKVQSIALGLDPIRDELIQFIHQQLVQFQPRDDYREQLQLSLVFLGSVSEAHVHIRTPGAIHRARWMAKLIYSLKIPIFRSQLKMAARELSAPGEFCVYVVKVYLKAWYTCGSAVSAPRNDLQLICDLYGYRDINAAISKAAIKSFSGHLWYLNEVLIGLAFFDLNVPVEMKTAMIAALRKTGKPDHPWRIVLTATDVQVKQLYDFVSQHTRTLITALDITHDFLIHDPCTWENNEVYIKSQKMLRGLKVVNDAAERGVALIQSFNSVITNQEEQKQYLLQVVEKHRLFFPNANKSTLLRH